MPGVLLLAAIGYLGKLIEQSIAIYAKAHRLHIPNIEYVLWAILIGLVIGNTIELPKFFQAGIASYEFFLKAGIVLLGSRFLLGDVAKLGGISLVLVAVEIVLSIAFMSVLGRLFGLNPKLTSLLAVAHPSAGCPRSSQHKEQSKPMTRTPPMRSRRSSPWVPSLSLYFL